MQNKRSQRMMVNTSADTKIKIEILAAINSMSTSNIINNIIKGFIEGYEEKYGDLRDPKNKHVPFLYHYDKERHEGKTINIWKWGGYFFGYGRKRGCQEIAFCGCVEPRKQI